MNPSIYIVVLNWNGAVDTLACLDSLAELDYDNYRVIVVDNGSTDNSMKLLRDQIHITRAELIETGVNLGYAGGNNVGIRYALDHDADFVLVLNNDTIVAPNLLSALYDAAVRYPDVGVFGPRILYLDNPHTVSFSGAYWNTRALHFVNEGEDEHESLLPTEDAVTDYVCGAALFFRSCVARQIGLFDTRFFLTWEESDWCFRARRAGFQCMVIPHARIWHRVAAAFSGETSPLRIYFTMRNRLLWAEKNLAWTLRLRVYLATFLRVVPEFHIPRHHPVYLPKRMFWAFLSWVQELNARRDRPAQRALRQALMDYMFRRFGDCPPSIRDLNREWMV